MCHTCPVDGARVACCATLAFTEGVRVAQSGQEWHVPCHSCPTGHVNKMACLCDGGIAVLSSALVHTTEDG